MNLSLGQNELTLEFPDFIPKCRNLTFLDLGSNKLTGLIPEMVFTNLGKLESLFLTDNSFHGSLSSNISILSKLKNLGLGSNQFTGPIPEDIGLISDLEIIEMYDLFLKDVLDQRLQPPIGPLANKVVLVVSMALACTRTTPES
ncbi:hypothetical protein L1049_015828 [Liquidambar formosana]|uniref:Uncharacterized protein n=1 Tax=Liquidambar formosana TaxID=63359 RepID=A0AAP0X6C9_LIQFO